MASSSDGVHVSPLLYCTHCIIDNYDIVITACTRLELVPMKPYQDARVPRYEIINFKVDIIVL